MKILKGYPADDLQELLTTFDIASVDQRIDFMRRLGFSGFLVVDPTGENRSCERGDSNPPRG